MLNYFFPKTEALCPKCGLGYDSKSGIKKFCTKCSNDNIRARAKDKQIKRLKAKRESKLV